MRVFVTGSTGFIGSQITKELLRAGHHVLGLTRSEEGAQSLQTSGAQVHRGNIVDLASLRSGAAESDGVIHCAFNHDFSKFAENCENDRRAIEAMGDELAGSNRPFIVTSGTGVGAVPGKVRTEDERPNPDGHAIPRIASELAAMKVAERGVPVSIVRLPQVHDTRKFGLISWVIDIAKAKGVSAYLGDGSQRWAAVHLLDAAPLYRLALEKRAKNARYHVVDEEGVLMRDMAEAIGRRLKLPVKSISADEAPAHFGWMSMFAGWDAPASGAKTREWLNWKPTHRGIIADLNEAQV